MALTFEIFKDRNGKFGWRLRAANGETVGASSGVYETKAFAQRAIELVRQSAAEATTRDLS